MTSLNQPPPTPREPEIELLGRIAGRFLWFVRRVLWLGGAAAIAHGCWRSSTDSGWDLDQPSTLATLPAATGVVWICLGAPLVVRVDWLFGRARHAALATGASLWFGACLLPREQEYGYVLRFFASLVACLTLLVWRTLWRLTRVGSR